MPLLRSHVAAAGSSLQQFLNKEPSSPAAFYEIPGHSTSNSVPGPTLGPTTPAQDHEPPKRVQLSETNPDSVISISNGECAPLRRSKRLGLVCDGIYPDTSGYLDLAKGVKKSQDRGKPKPHNDLSLCNFVCVDGASAFTGEQGEASGARGRGLINLTDSPNSYTESMSNKIVVQESQDKRTETFRKRLKLSESKTQVHENIDTGGSKVGEKPTTTQPINALSNRDTSFSSSRLSSDSSHSEDDVKELTAVPSSVKERSEELLEEAGPSKGPPQMDCTSKTLAGDRAEATRARFLAIARRRAAHFAHYDSHASEPPSSPPANLRRCSRRPRNEQGPELQQSLAEQEDWPGPFSTARRLVEGRAAAAAARQQVEKVDIKSSLVDWQPSRVCSGTCSVDKSLPSLHDLCCKVICANVERFESLYGLPDSTKHRICANLCERRKMGPAAFALFIVEAPSEIRVPDCSHVSEKEVMQMVTQFTGKNLEVLELGNCGRWFSDQCVSAMVARSNGSLPSLYTVSLRGAYRLTDNGLADFVRATPVLTSLDLTDCSYLSELGIQIVADCLGSNLNKLCLDGCKQLNVSKMLLVLLNMRQLQSLSLANVAGMCDELVSELAVHLGLTLQELSLAHCSSLTDAAMAAVGACCSGLKSLNVDSLQLLTDSSIGRITDGCRSLLNLTLTRCKFSDEAVAAYVTASGSSLCELSLNGVRQAADQTLVALSKHAQSSLKLLDASWCRLMSDEGLGYLADSCLNLCELRLYGCTQVTEKFLKGHSNAGLKVIGF
eukprot:c26376_g2_i1 orf=2-2341(+)